MNVVPLALRTQMMDQRINFGGMLRTVPTNTEVFLRGL